MALSRWSHSAWYIYESDELELHIEGSGHCTLEDLNLDFQGTLNKLSSGYSDIDTLELKLYLKGWMLFHNKELSFKEYVKRLNVLRNYGYRKNYLRYGTEPYYWEKDGIPSKEKAYLVKDDKAFFKTIDDCDKILITVKSKNVFTYLNSKQELVNIEVSKYGLTKFYDMYPIIIGETYYYGKKGSTIYNKYKAKYKEENIHFLQTKIQKFEIFLDKIIDEEEQEIDDI